MAVDMNAATTEYGVTANLINAIPELQQTLATAASQGWSQDKLNATVAQSDWYQQHGQNLRNLLMQAATDPATYQENLKNAQALVSQTANTMGRYIGDPAGLAYQYLAGGWTTDQLKNTIGGTGNATPEEGTTGLWGDAGQLQAHLEQTAQAYGVPYTSDYINSYINKIQAGQDTTDGFDSVMRARAKASFPQFADQLDAGQTMTQIADPYMATMAKTLEVPQTKITLNDPLVKKALSYTDPKTGTQNSQPLWQFEQTLKADPRYDMTDQAKTDAYSTLKQIGTDWGFTK